MARNRKYSQLVVHVQSQITERLRHLEVGDSLPGEVDLSAGCGVSRTTIRKALGLMQKEGLLRTDELGRRYLVRKTRTTELPKSEGEPISRDRRVARFVLDQIGSGAILPGDRISESKIASELGFSTGPVREGLLLLAPLGLLRKRARRQWEASSLTAQQWEHLAELRLLVEEYCLKKLFEGPLPEGHRRFLEAHLQRTVELGELKKVDMGELRELDMKFHQWLLDSAGNPMLSERNHFIYLLIEFQMRNSRYSMDRARLGLDQHVTIMKAILTGDSVAAVISLRQHLDSSLETLKSIALPRGDGASSKTSPDHPVEFRGRDRVFPAA
ncbi:MAG: GntR family transcriptional regulator [Opitutaceae bacterium]|nr:GntR family transcriptional regulator [Opitutaceae bacterium]